MKREQKVAVVGFVSAFVGLAALAAPLQADDVKTCTTMSNWAKARVWTPEFSERSEGAQMAKATMDELVNTILSDDQRTKIKKYTASTNPAIKADDIGATSEDGRLLRKSIVESLEKYRTQGLPRKNAQGRNANQLIEWATCSPHGSKQVVPDSQKDGSHTDLIRCEDSPEFSHIPEAGQDLIWHFTENQELIVTACHTGIEHEMICSNRKILSTDPKSPANLAPANIEQLYVMTDGPNHNYVTQPLAAKLLENTDGELSVKNLQVSDSLGVAESRDQFTRRIVAKYCKPDGVAVADRAAPEHPTTTEIGTVGTAPIGLTYLSKGSHGAGN